jgi:hypothetical protein
MDTGSCRVTAGSLVWSWHASAGSEFVVWHLGWMGADCCRSDILVAQEFLHNIQGAPLFRQIPDPEIFRKDEEDRCRCYNRFPRP